MIDSQISLFGTPDQDPDQDPDHEAEPSFAGPEIESVAEVFELAREVMGGQDDLSGASETPALAKARARREAKAGELGLVARWGDYKKARGYVAIHDPTTGEWHDLPFADAPAWAKWETTKRSEIYRKTGDDGAFDLSAEQMHKIWEEEHPLEDEGIVEEYELPDD